MPNLDQAVKSIRVKNPITQEFHGGNGKWTQANIEKQRSYNLPQWKALTEESQFQPPARRGERRKNTEKRTPAAQRAKNSPIPLAPGQKRKAGRPRVRPIKQEKDEEAAAILRGPPTPTSPETKLEELDDMSEEEKVKSKGRGKGKTSVSERRKYNRKEMADHVDESAFVDFDYRIHDADEWTADKCEELEERYWKSLMYANPMYGADMPGSLFDASTTSWNVAHLPNLLDVLGQKVPGVNTAYLYLGMWKATFAWHLEDVDLYSINYIHFGAPKQWYSISQEDAPRFEAAMRDIWPSEAKNCDQFLRHKTFLISPSILKSKYNITVNRLVHNEGEFVITYPYGYHSGFNFGYNCAESVNFATHSWLNYGRIAKKCHCEADSVWIDVDEIERKLRGEATPDYEYYEVTDDEAMDEEDDGPIDLPTPPGSEPGKPKATRKRKSADSKQPRQVKRIKVKDLPKKQPCCLCPNDFPGERLIKTENGKEVHATCALYLPETYTGPDEAGNEVAFGVTNIQKARLGLKCYLCHVKVGACVQCAYGDCYRSYHPTCMAAAGVMVEMGPIGVMIDDVEYLDTGIDFRCRFHRPDKRPKDCSEIDADTMAKINERAPQVAVGETVQYQFFQTHEISAGVVVKNNSSEGTMIVKSLSSLSKNKMVEVPYKYMLFFYPEYSRLQKPSRDAKPLPQSLVLSKAGAENTRRKPCEGDPFNVPESIHKWGAFDCRGPEKGVSVNFDLPNQIWHYLGGTSTDTRAQYTENIALLRHNVESDFLARTRPTWEKPKPKAQQSYPASYPNVATNLPLFHTQQQLLQAQKKATFEAYNSRPGSMVDPHALSRQVELLRQQQEQKRAAAGQSQKGSMPPPVLNAHNAASPHIWSPTPQSVIQQHKQYFNTAAPPQMQAGLERNKISRQQMENQKAAAAKAEAAAQIQQAAPQADQSIIKAAFPSCDPSPDNYYRLKGKPPIVRSFDSLPATVKKYPYLADCYLRMPLKYHSPYQRNSGFTEYGLPNPGLGQSPKKVSLAKDYFANRSETEKSEIMKKWSLMLPPTLRVKREQSEPARQVETVEVEQPKRKILIKQESEPSTPSMNPVLLPEDLPPQPAGGVRGLAGRARAKSLNQTYPSKPSHKSSLSRDYLKSLSLNEQETIKRQLATTKPPSVRWQEEKKDKPASSTAMTTKNALFMSPPISAPSTRPTTSVGPHHMVQVRSRSMSGRPMSLTGARLDALAFSQPFALPGPLRLDHNIFSRNPNPFNGSGVNAFSKASSVFSPTFSSSAAPTRPTSSSDVMLSQLSPHAWQPQPFAVSQPPYSPSHTASQGFDPSRPPSSSHSPTLLSLDNPAFYRFGGDGSLMVDQIPSGSDNEFFRDFQRTSGRGSLSGSPNGGANGFS